MWLCLLINNDNSTVIGWIVEYKGPDEVYIFAIGYWSISDRNHVPDIHL